MNKEWDRQKNIISRLKPIASQLENKEFRDSYIASHIKRFLAAQMKNLRGEKTQKEFAKILGTTQSVVSSRYENADYGNVTLQTLIDIASKLDVALIVRFATFSEFFKITSDFSSNAQKPDSYSYREIEDVVSYGRSSEGWASLIESKTRLAKRSAQSMAYSDKSSASSVYYATAHDISRDLASASVHENRNFFQNNQNQIAKVRNNETCH